MKKYRILLVFTFIVTLLITTQVFAGPAIPQNGSHTPVPQTPGAHATEKANENATKQADKPPHGKHENYKGTVSAVDSSSITLTLHDGSSVTIGLSADSRMKFPGPKD